MNNNISVMEKLDNSIEYLRGRIQNQEMLLSKMEGLHFKDKAMTAGLEGLKQGLREGLQEVGSIKEEYMKLCERCKELL